MAAAAAKTLAATMAVAATMLAAIQWYHAALYISSCVGSLGQVTIVFALYLRAL